VASAPAQWNNRPHTMEIQIHRGLSLDLAGGPQQVIDSAPRTTRAGFIGAEHRDIRPNLAIAVGDTIKLGDPLFADRRHPELCFTTPASGRILDIVWGSKRRLASIIIDSTATDSNPILLDDPGPLSALRADHIRSILMRSGLWSAVRARPFSIIPVAAARAPALFVSLIDTHPWSADPAVVIAGRERELAAGLTVLSNLTERLYVCKPPPLALEPIEASNVQIVDVSGPHPAGLPGTQIELLAPVRHDRAAWYVGYQDVMAIGELFTTGRLTHERVIAIAGPGLKRPRLLRTHVGASIDELLTEETSADSFVVAGSILSGRAVTPDTAFLGRYDTQLSVLPMRPVAESVGDEYPSAMLPLERFDAVWPLHSPPLVLLRALLSGDTETAEALGCLGLDEEDLALCAQVCPAGIDYGAALRGVLDDLRKQI